MNSRFGRRFWWWSRTRVLMGPPRYGRLFLPVTRARSELYRLRDHLGFYGLHAFGVDLRGIEDLMGPSVASLFEGHADCLVNISHLDDERLTAAKKLVFLVAVEALQPAFAIVENKENAGGRVVCRRVLDGREKLTSDALSAVGRRDRNLVDREHVRAKGCGDMRVSTGLPYFDVFGITGAEGDPYGAIILESSEDAAWDTELVLGGGARDAVRRWVVDVLGEESPRHLTVELVAEGRHRVGHRFRVAVRLDNTGEMPSGLGVGSSGTEVVR